MGSITDTVKEAILTAQADTQIAIIRAVVLKMTEDGEVGGSQDGCVSLEEASQLLAGISVREVHRKCENGELRKVKLGERKSGITRASIRNYIRRNEVKPGLGNPHGERDVAGEGID
jgi:predicted DNA-binding transcriptional regulator AlpA